MANWFGSAGARGVQLRPRSRGEGVGRDLVVVAGAVAAVVVLLALLVLLLVPAEARPGFLGGGPPPGTSIDVPVDRVIARLPDGRTALGSFTLRMRADEAPSQLRTIAARTPTPVREDAPPPSGTPRAAGGSAESLVREKVADAMASLSYQRTAGEAGKELLRQTVRDAVNESLPGAPVQQVYIREYLVQ